MLPKVSWQCYRWFVARYGPRPGKRRSVERMQSRLTKLRLEQEHLQYLLEDIRRWDDRYSAALDAWLTI